MHHQRDVRSLPVTGNNIFVLPGVEISNKSGLYLDLELGSTYFFRAVHVSLRPYIYSMLRQREVSFIVGPTHGHMYRGSRNVAF